MPKVKYFVFWITLIMIIVFVLQVFINGFTDLFKLTGFAYSQPWRFISAIFLHGSPAHLISNLFALLFFGFILEKTIGSNRFLGIYLISGIAANIIATNFYPSSLGASGAIMGIIGALAILRPGMNVWAFGLIMPMAAAAIVWIIVDAIGIFIPSEIGHIAHLSGIFFGAVFGIIIKAYHYKKNNKTHKIEIPEHILRRWETLYMGG